MEKNTFLVEVTFNDATRTVIPEYFFLNKFHSWGWEYSWHVQSEVDHKRFALNKDMEREIKFEMSLKDIPWVSKANLPNCLVEFTWIKI